MIRTLTYTVGELIPYINWTYFFQIGRAHV